MPTNVEIVCPSCGAAEMRDERFDCGSSLIPEIIWMSCGNGFPHPTKQEFRQSDTCKLAVLKKAAAFAQDILSAMHAGGHGTQFVNGYSVPSCLEALESALGETG